MELPHDVCQLINEYAMPITRPNWRTLHRMPYEVLLGDVGDKCCDIDSDDDTLWTLREAKTVFTSFRYVRMFYDDSYGSIRYHLY
jgi:hypothetical protein